MTLVTRAKAVKIEVQPLQFSGLNKKEVINDDEISSGSNIGSDNLPKLSPRLPREDLGYTLTTPKDLFSAGGKLAWVDGTSFYYDGVSKGTVTATKKSMVDFNGHIVIFPDKKYYCYDSDNIAYDTFGTFTAPDLDYVTIHYNRVFGCKGDSIRGSKWGDFKEWEDFTGEQDDSWATDVVTKGDFTGIFTYQDHVIFFKSDYMTELYGAYPSQFSLIDVGRYGITDSRAVAEGNGYLLFVDKDGVKQYTGGIPKPVSDKLNEIYGSSALVSDGTRFYLFNNDGANNKVYVMDLRTMTWLPEDTLNVVAFTDIARTVYALDTSGKIWKFNSGTSTDIEWSFTTKEFDMNSFFKKVVKKIKIKAKMDLGAILKVFVNKNGTGFEPFNEFVYHSADDYREIYCLIDLERSNRFQVRIDGIGKSIVSGMVEYSFRSDKR